MIELLDSNLAWFEKYRPQTIDDVVFEDEVVEQKMKEFIDNGKIVGNIISYGDGGTGKSTINQVLYTSIIKDRADIWKLKKSVKDAEKLRAWLMDTPEKSSQKIVVCEEFDKLSKDAQTELKDGLMEKHMAYVSFIVTTNNIHKIDPALLQRFNIKLNFTKFNIDGVYWRMIKILDLEKVQYNTDEVYQLVNSFQTKGIRNLLNALQYGTINGEFKIGNLNGYNTTAGIEDLLISYIKYILDTLYTYEPEEIYKVAINPGKDINIKPYYDAMIEKMKHDSSINYEYMFKTILNDDDVLLPIKLVFEKFYQQLELVPLKHIHTQAALFEAICTVYTLKGGEKRLIH